MHVDYAFLVKTYFGVPVALPKGKLAVTLSESAALKATLGQGLGCGLQFPLFTYPFPIVVAGVPIPAYVRISANGTLTVGSRDLSATAAESASLTAGAAFDGKRITALADARGKAGLTIDGGAKLFAGFIVRGAIGVVDTGDVHLDAKPGFTIEGNVDGKLRG